MLVAFLISHTRLIKYLKLDPCLYSKWLADHLVVNIFVGCFTALSVKILYNINNKIAVELQRILKRNDHRLIEV